MEEKERKTQEEIDLIRENQQCNQTIKVLLARSKKIEKRINKNIDMFYNGPENDPENKMNVLYLNRAVYLKTDYDGLTDLVLNFLQIYKTCLSPLDYNNYCDRINTCLDNREIFKTKISEMKKEFKQKTRNSGMNNQGIDINTRADVLLKGKENNKEK